MQRKVTKSKVTNGLLSGSFLSPLMIAKISTAKTAMFTTKSCSGVREKLWKLYMNYPLVVSYIVLLGILPLCCGSYL